MGISLKDITDGAKLDILDLLNKESVHTFEFRRISQICEILIPVCNSYRQPSEHGALSAAMRASESIAPTLFDVLQGRAFDGDALLREKYQDLKKTHQELRQKALDIQDAAAHVQEEKENLAAHHRALVAHEQRLERERDRLMLTAESRGIKADLPTLPALPKGFDDDEEEIDEDNKNADPRDTNQS